MIKFEIAAKYSNQLLGQTGIWDRNFTIKEKAAGVRTWDFENFLDLTHRSTKKSKKEMRKLADKYGEQCEKTLKVKKA